jgi:signal transduction histidine kinase/putative methionine-R-sulfoxide reductase with GAF domain
LSQAVDSPLQLGAPRELLDAILRHLGDGVVVLSPTGERVYANDEAARLMGYASAEVYLTAPAADARERFVVLHPDGSPMDRSELPGARVLAGAEPEPMLVRYREVGVPGDRFSMITALPIRDHAERLQYVISFIRDVTTEHRLAEHQRIAADAGAALNATLDYTATLDALANAIVPQLADWCLVDVVSADGRLERVLNAHADPAKADLLAQLRTQWPPMPDDGVGSPAVARTRESVLAPEIDDDVLVRAAKDDDHLRALRELGFCSYMCVPIEAGPRLLGVLTFVTSESGRRYDEADLALATDLAARAAAAIENATLFREAEQMTALLDSLYASAPVGLGFYDTELRYVRVNDALAAINERPVSEHIGRRIDDVIPELAPSIEPIARRVIDTGRPVLGVEVSGGAPHERRGWVGSYYPVLSSSGEVLGVGAVVEDVTERRRAQQRTELQHAVTQILSTAERAVDAVPRVLEALGETLGWDVACYWPADADGPRPIWVRPGVQLDGFVAMTERVNLSPELLPGRVHRTGEIEWLEDLTPDRFARASVAAAEGLRSGVAFPVCVGGEVVGVLEAFSRIRRARDRELHEPLDAIGAQLGQFLSRKHAEEDRLHLLQRERHARAEAEAAAATLRKLERVSEAALEHISLRDLLQALLERIVEVLEADTAAILLVEDDGDLHVRATIGLDEQRERAVIVPMGQGLAGRIAAERRSLVVPDLSTVELVSPVLRERGMNSLVAIPLLAEDRVIGVLHAGSEAYAQFVEEDVRLLELIADRIALAINQAALYEAERAIQERLSFLGEASTVLASSLDVDATLTRVAQLAVPHFADWCVVDLLHDDGAIRRLAIVHSNQEKVLVGQRLAEAFPERLEDERGIGAVVRTGRPLLVPEIDAAALDRVYGDRPELVEQLLELELRSAMVVPLTARGTTLGAVTFVSAESRSRYDAADLRFAQELAARAAAAIDNAHLFLEAERSRERLAFLAEASALLGSSLDVERTLGQLASLVAGRVADWCAIHLVDEHGSVRVATTAHSDPLRSAAAHEEIAGFPPERPPPPAVRQVIDSGAPILFGAGGSGVVPPDSFEGPDAIHTGIVVPLVARSRPLGTLTLARAETHATYGEADVRFALDLARRAAVAIDNAQLYRAAEERAQAARVLASVGDGVFLVDSHGLVRTWNRAASVVTGLRTTDVVDRPAAEAIPGWAAIASRVPVASRGAAAPRAESLPLGLGERELWLSIHGVAVPDGIVYAFRDLTEERALEAMRTEFVSTVSHELRTPLAAIYGAAMTLRRSDVSLDEQQRARLLDVVSGEADRLARTVNDILWASRLDTDSLHVTISTFDPLALARDVVSAQRTHLDQAHALVLEAEAELPEVASDPDKVGRVLINLVDNGVKYSPDGGKVEVRLARVGAHVRFSVTDQGLGIPLAEQRRIFEKFYRLDPNMTRGVGGTGLGLYICREIVRRMDGRIWVDSPGLGRGSTFHVELPVATEF